MDAALAGSRHVLGADLSIVDVAWLVYVQRLDYADYPIRHLHPHIAAWQTRLMGQPAIARELDLPEPLQDMVAERHRSLAEAGQTLASVCFPEVVAPSISG